jgi:ABC-type branched-subunit amino acid transport system substrate-binding protein
MKRRWLGFVSLLAAFSLVIAACGDDDTSDTTEGTTAGTTATTEATTTTAAPTTTADMGDGDGMDVAFDTGVTPAPCDDAVNEGNGCIYLGVISDLTEGPFAPLGVPLTTAQEHFWAEVNEAGGIDGWDVIINADNTFDAKYDPALTAEGATGLADRVLGLAQSLGTPQTQAALGILDENDMVTAPATWFSGWAFDDVDQGLVMEAGASYCVEAMNAMYFLTENFGTDFSWALVVFPGDYGGDYGAGAKIAAAQLGLGEPVAEILQVPISFGGDVAEAVATLLTEQPNVIVMTTGPTEMAQVAAGLFQNGFQTFQIMGAGPSWNVALKANADLMPLLEAVYWNSAPWGGWDTLTDGHTAMRAAAEKYGQDPHNSYVAGWVFQYIWKALLEEAVASGDLTRANVRALADGLEVDFAGMLPTYTYGDVPADFAERSTIISRADATTSDGLAAQTDPFVSPIAADFDLVAPCFVG